ncbi:hypothetical protein H6800_01325 [Candidatus Nomurabacteria bacterium]|nr:hypothetical protein [Candidatus Nomurabacteria bacterium]
MYDELVNNIKRLLNNQEVAVIAISGHGGSGKTTLAKRLAEDFDIAAEQIVGLDNLHAKNYEDAKGLFELSDWAVIMELLKDIHTSGRLQYQTRDWKGVESRVDVAMPSLVIIEGVRLLRPEIKPYVDICVWIDCPLDVASVRAKDRNRQQGDTEEEIALWDTKWIPEAKKYVEKIHPEKIADFIYTDQES